MGQPAVTTPEDTTQSEVPEIVDPEMLTEREEAPLTDEEATAQMAAGYLDGQGGERPPDGQPETDASPQEETPPVTPEPEPAPAPEYVQLTQQQLDDLLQTATAVQEIKAAVGKRFDDAYGKMGGLEQTIRALQQATPLGETVTVTEEDFAELAEEYPDLAAMHATALNRVLSKVKGTGGGTPASAAPPVLDPEVIRMAITQEVEAIEERQAERMLNWLQKDWRSIVGEKGSQTPFRQWLATQEASYQAEVTNTWDPFVMAEAIERFTTATHAPTPSAGDPAPPPLPKPSAHQTRAERFRAAVPPKSTGGTPTPTQKTDEEQFYEGYYGKKS